MKKFIISTAIALMMPAMASSALTVTLGDKEIKDGDVLKYSTADIELGMFGWQKEMHFIVNGAAPVNVNISSNTDRFTFCTTSCYPLMDKDGTGIYTGKDVISATPQNLDVDWYSANYDETPGDYDDNCAVKLSGDEGELSFRIEVSTLTGGVDGIIDASSSCDGKIFNLQGAEVRRSALTPGIYVRDGKKFVVR